MKVPLGRVHSTWWLHMSTGRHRSRRHLLLILPCLLAVALHSDGHALERAERSLDRPGPDNWLQGGNCIVSYYNTCTSWIWIWSDFEPTDRLGVVFTCGSGAGLDRTNMYVWSGSPSGYGLTGTLSVHDVDGNGCPDGLLGSTPWLPVSGSNVVSWYVGTSGSVALIYEFPGQAETFPTVFASDHPAPGPTGPVACGTCYPSNRAGHSFYFGTASSPLCPASPLFDGFCAVEFYGWSAVFSVPTSTENSTWSHVKALYR